jgi:hypothetical protein
MSTETATVASTASGTNSGNWRAGVAGGLAGGAVFGVLMTVTMRNVVETAIPVMYGLGTPNGVAGWAIHMSHSAVLGVAFAAVVGVAGLVGRSGRIQVGAGIVYGLLLWAVLATFVMPAWVGAVGPMNPPVPDVNPTSAAGHAGYGAVLGGVYYALEGS